jgi:hypothetical protein
MASLLLAASAATLVAGMQVGEPLPALEGEFLSGSRAALPQAASGRVALLLLGFTYESRFAVEAWAGRFRRDFAGDRRVTFYEIPMIGGIARLGKWFIDSGMRRGTPKEDYENVITVYGATDAWKRRVGFGDPNAAYPILIGPDGKVVRLVSGGFGEEPYQALRSEVVRLLGGQ